MKSNLICYEKIISRNSSRNVMSCNWNCKIVGSKSRQLIFYEHKTYLAQYDWVHLLVQKMILKKRNSMKGLVRVRRPNNVE